MFMECGTYLYFGFYTCILYRQQPVLNYILIVLAIVTLIRENEIFVNKPGMKTLLPAYAGSRVGRVFILGIIIDYEETPQRKIRALKLYRFVCLCFSVKLCLPPPSPSPPPRFVYTMCW